MFEPPETPNRRMTPEELQDEYVLASIFKRPPRYFTKDKPFYPYVPTNCNCKVNFDLNYP